LIGVAYGFLVSRIAFLGQDFFVIAMIGARGWFKLSRCFHLVIQIVLGVGAWLILRSFNLSLVLQLCLAAFHGVIVAIWLLRKDLAKLRARLSGLPLVC
jgi:hypothetical protein